VPSGSTSCAKKCRTVAAGAAARLPHTATPSAPARGPGQGSTPRPASPACRPLRIADGPAAAQAAAAAATVADLSGLISPGRRARTLAVVGSCSRPCHPLQKKPRPGGCSHNTHKSAATPHWSQEPAAPAGGQSVSLAAALAIPGLSDAGPQARSFFHAKSTRRQAHGQSPGKGGAAMTAPAARAAFLAAQCATSRPVAGVVAGTALRSPGADAAARPPQRQAFAPAAAHDGSDSRLRFGVGATPSQTTM
jgi:hypothetical protein